MHGNLCLRRTTWVATRQHAFQNCACWFSITVIHRPFLVNAQHLRVRPKDVPYSYHVSSTRSRRKLACESSAKEKLTESASGLGISVIDSTVMVNVQFLCVWPKGLPHGHIYIAAAHTPPHKLLQEQSTILKKVGPTRLVRAKYYVAPPVTSAFWLPISKVSCSRLHPMQSPCTIATGKILGLTPASHLPVKCLCCNTAAVSNLQSTQLFQPSIIHWGLSHKLQWTAMK